MSKITAALLSLSFLFATPALADNPFDPDILDELEIEIDKQPQESDDKLTPYILYGYEGSKLFISTRDGRFRFIPTLTLQVRHQNEWDASGLTSSGFLLRRARLQLDGTFLTPDLKYESDLEFQTPRSGAGPMELKDFYLDYRWTQQLRLRIGQYKVPYSYQFIVSGTRQQFNERSIANSAFSPGRDIGVMLHGRSPHKDWLYSVGVFNGSGPNTRNQNLSPTGLAHLRWTPWGRYPTEEGDFESVPDPRLLLTAQSILKQSDSAQDSLLEGSVFGGFKWRGLSLSGQFYQRNNFHDRDMEAQDALGYFLQGGYFILPQKLELAARHALVWPTGQSFQASARQEYALALNYYIMGQHLKTQLDYTARLDPTQTQAWSHRVITQVQLNF